MTQLAFQNIRNLGANGNQPLITNQNDFAIFDNVTWLKGSHTFRMGGSMTFRTREILNADSIVGNFGFNNNQTSNCSGQPAGCVINSATGFDVASFLLGYTSGKTRNLFDAETYTEKRPEYSLYFQDDWRPTSRLTLNLGLRYDVYPPWIEVDDRQSNFDPSTGQVRRGLRQRRHRRRRGGPVPADVLEEGLRPALRLRLRPRWQRQDARSRRLRRLLELHAGRHLVVQGAEPALPAVDGTDDLADRLRHQPAAQGRPAAASGRRPEPAARRAPRVRSSTSTSATPTRGSGTSTSSAASAPTTWWRSPTSARRAGRCCSRATRTRRRPWSA